MKKLLFCFVQNFTTFEEIVKHQYGGNILSSQIISILYIAYQKYSDEVLVPDNNYCQLLPGTDHEDMYDLEFAELYDLKY